jgi:hypothetical protein
MEKIVIAWWLLTIPMSYLEAFSLIKLFRVKEVSPIGLIICAMFWWGLYFLLTLIY